MTDPAVVQLYSRWLDHVTRQLNQKRADYLSTFELLPDDSRLFGIVTFKLAGPVGADPAIKTVRVAVPPASENLFQEAVDGLGLARGPANKRRQLNDGVRYLGNVTGHKREVKSACPLLPIVNGVEQRNVKRLFPKYDELARSYVQYYPDFALMLNRLVDLSHSGRTDLGSEQIEKIAGLYRKAYESAKDYVRERLSALDEKPNGESSGQDASSQSTLERDLKLCREHFETPKHNTHVLPVKFKEILKKRRVQYDTRA